ncbi:MAG: Rpn family recombination-promoting nuclease/putative transposase [Rivularia sp. (in: Bacteria)]|nr:Rpn family recombination-promoting nuclease/putative transposase [Rivularia sp. MS3]
MAYDNTCKYLAETYPTEFANWLLSTDTSNIKVLKTELNLEPIRADSVTLLQTSNQILHIEFQTQPESKPPLDFRMLDYYVRLKKIYKCDIEQVIIFLQPSNSEMVFKTEYVDKNTRHGYRVIRLWEQDSTTLLNNPALLPLAVLAKSNSPESLLQQVASQVDMIEESEAQKNISACTQILAGLRFDRNLINQLFREEIMQESVIYQDIIQRGEAIGEQRGKKQEALNYTMRLLNRRIGNINSQTQQQIDALSTTQLEDLGEALLDFSSSNDLTTWLENNS